MKKFFTTTLLVITAISVVTAQKNEGGIDAKMLEKIKSGEADYTFVEIMGCPGGCVNGGGQPQVPYGIRNFTDIRAERAKVLYSLDAKNTLRKSHENAAVKELYETYLGEPGSEKAHHLLHTHYVKRTINKKF